MLRYIKGAIPGKPLKKTGSETEREEKKTQASRRYEAQRAPRKLSLKWKENRDWLEFDTERNTMSCSVCVGVYGIGKASAGRGTNTFLTGCSNARVSAVTDHECSVAHRRAVERFASKTPASHIVNKAPAVAALISLKQTERHRMTHLFRNVHAILKKNRPFSDFVWLCGLDKAKGLDIGETYINEKSVLTFSKSIANVEKQITKELLKKTPFFSFMMDGSTDISGDEQEAVYVRCSVMGKMTERFLGIGSPTSTCSRDLKDFLINMLDEHDVNKAKLVGMGSDGASNMTGHKSGLVALLKQDVNPEMINIHCFAHRLELSFRDVMKKNTLYDKTMTLLIGLYYYYTKQYKNKSGLKNAIALFGGVMPCKVTGTRWLAHLSRGIAAFIRTFKAYDAHLATQSHDKAKAEGLLKIMINKDVLCFILFLQEILKPLMRLSLKLQTPGTTLGDASVWIAVTIDVLKEYKERDMEELSGVLASGLYQGVELKGRTPTMAYKDRIIDGLVAAIENRFEAGVDNITNSASKILQLEKWPVIGSPDVKEYVVAELLAVASHFKESLTKADPSFSSDEAKEELKTLKRILYKRHGEGLQSLTWKDVTDDLKDFPSFQLVIDLINCLPSTSVTCETTFSQMKLIKTSRRFSFANSTLNNLLLVKLQSPTIEEYNPSTAIDDWMTASLMPRRPGYKRKREVEHPVTGIKAKKQTTHEIGAGVLEETGGAGVLEETGGAGVLEKTGGAGVLEKTGGAGVLEKTGGAGVLEKTGGAGVLEETGGAGVLKETGGAGVLKETGGAGVLKTGGAGVLDETGGAGVLKETGGSGVLKETGGAGVLEKTGGAGVLKETGGAGLLEETGSAGVLEKTGGAGVLKTGVLEKTGGAGLLEETGGAGVLEEMDIDEDLILHLNGVFGKDDKDMDDFCEDFQSEDENWNKIIMFARSF